MCYRELDLFNCGNSALGFIHRVVISHIGQGVYVVKLLALKRRHGRILHKHLAVIHLAYRTSVYRVLILILYAKRLGVFSFIRLKLVVIKDCGYRIIHLILGRAKIYCSAHVAYLFDRYSAVKKLRDSCDYLLSHTIGQKVCAAVYKHRAANLIVPIVVVCKSA